MGNSREVTETNIGSGADQASGGDLDAEKAPQGMALPPGQYDIAALAALPLNPKLHPLVDKVERAIEHRARTRGFHSNYERYHLALTIAHSMEALPPGQSDREESRVLVEKVARALCWKNGMNPDLTLGGDDENFLWMEYEDQAEAVIPIVKAWCSLVNGLEQVIAQPQEECIGSHCLCTNIAGDSPDCPIHGKQENAPDIVGLIERLRQYGKDNHVWRDVMDEAAAALAKLQADLDITRKALRDACDDDELVKAQAEIATLRERVKELEVEAHLGPRREQSFRRQMDKELTLRMALQRDLAAAIAKLQEELFKRNQDANNYQTAWLSSTEVHRQHMANAEAEIAKLRERVKELEACELGMKTMEQLAEHNANIAEKAQRDLAAANEQIAALRADRDSFRNLFCEASQDDDITAQADDVLALRAERDALQSENERLNELLENVGTQIVDRDADQIKLRAERDALLAKAPPIEPFYHCPNCDCFFDKEGVIPSPKYPDPDRAQPQEECSCSLVAADSPDCPIHGKRQNLEKLKDDLRKHHDYCFEKAKVLSNLNKPYTDNDYGRSAAIAKDALAALNERGKG